LSTTPMRRKVKWYFDANGNVGKSHFCRTYRDRNGQRPYVVTGGKHADIIYAYDYQRVVFFDFPRSMEERVPYEVLEAFKNGYFLSTKYEVRTVRFSVPHVVIFANFLPDTTKLSADRWDIITI